MSQVAASWAQPVGIVRGTMVVASLRELQGTSD